MLLTHEYSARPETHWLGNDAIRLWKKLKVVGAGGDWNYIDRSKPNTIKIYRMVVSFLRHRTSLFFFFFLFSPECANHIQTWTKTSLGNLAKMLAVATSPARKCKRVAHKSNICASTDEGKYASVGSFLASWAHLTAVEGKEKLKPLVSWSYTSK